MNRRIEVRIERLIVDGLLLTPADRTLFHAALERELADLFASDGIGSPSGGAFQRVVAPALQFVAASEPHALAGDVARSIHRAVGSVATPGGGLDERA